MEGEHYEHAELDYRHGHDGRGISLGVTSEGLGANVATNNC
jgi:hypothetical protein